MADKGAKRMVDTQDLKARAEALFKRSGEGDTAATDEYEARCRAIAEKTKRLRELRLAKAQNGRS
jgi:hypothetical protein